MTHRLHVRSLPSPKDTQRPYTRMLSGVKGICSFLWGQVLSHSLSVDRHLGLLSGVVRRARNRYPQGVADSPYAYKICSTFRKGVSLGQLYPTLKRNLVWLLKKVGLVLPRRLASRTAQYLLSGYGVGVFQCPEALASLYGDPRTTRFWNPTP